MAHDNSCHAASLPNANLKAPEHRTVASYERELNKHRSTETLLREALAREEALLRKKDELIQQQQVLSKEADHRLLNGLQMIVSLLRLQGLASSDAEAASQLLIAANRVAAIERVHRRLHYLDGIQSVSFKQYLDDLCRDFSTMFSSGERQERVIAVEGVEIKLPTVTAIPLGFIVNELITNAVKYGRGRITVSLESRPERHALSVANDGPALPEGFDPAACTGLRMRIIRSFVERIGAELQVSRGDRNQGARLTVLFS